jgi:hypothetical protein
MFKRCCSKRCSPLVTKLNSTLAWVWLALRNKCDVQRIVMTVAGQKLVRVVDRCTPSVWLG